MLRKLIPIVAVAALASYAVAQPTTTIDPSVSSGSIADRHYVDVNVTALGAGATNWTAGGLEATTSNGASFVFVQDANGVNQFTTPDPTGSGAAALRETTFVSFPSGLAAKKRFNAVGTPDIAGKFIGGTGLATATAGTLDVALFDTPPSDGPTGTPGYTGRVAIDFAAGSETVYAVTGTTPNNAGDTLLVSGSFATATNADTSLVPVLFTMWVTPEPGTLVMLMLGGLAALRRRA